MKLKHAVLSLLSKVYLFRGRLFLDFWLSCFLADVPLRIQLFVLGAAVAQVVCIRLETEINLV